MANTYGVLKAFQFERPVYHITVPYWLNDPCAPGYDNSTNTYHLFFQCNPHGCQWGNMSWCYCYSKDLVHWQFAQNPVALRPDQDYDRTGVFTGCIASCEGGELEVIYSSVKALPFHWSTPPYPRGAAGLSLARSVDGGNTWTKHMGNPIVADEPDAVQVTGFRDPYLAEWPALDRLRGTQKSLYGLISGGIQNNGPTTFLYNCRPKRLADWTYLGPLIDLPLRFEPSEKWSNNYGANWECTTFMSLSSSCGTFNANFLILGCEGDREKTHVKVHARPPNVAARAIRSQQWMCGDLATGPSCNEVRMRFKYGGMLDHGTYYAANSFQDVSTGRRLVFGWIPEEDAPAVCADDKGWNGSLALPREVDMHVMRKVTRALRSELDAMACLEMIPAKSVGEPRTMVTLSVYPAREVYKLQDNALSNRELKNLVEPYLASPTLQLRTCAYSIAATVKVDPAHCSSVGLYVRHSKN